MRRKGKDYSSSSSDLLLGTNFQSLEWSRPPQQFVKINCDASVSPQFDRCAIAVWARDHVGHTLAARGVTIPSCQTIAEAEGRALNLGMGLAKELQLPRVIFESDCAEVVNSVNKKLNPSHWDQQWFINCCRYLKCEYNWKTHLIRREANGLADALARKCRSQGWSWTRLDAIPRL
ncbi:hypothetical protein QQ045_019644 [Rhodiola kirilowii]